MNVVLSAEGAFRVYFNRPQEYPRVWCVSDVEHNWELTLTEVNLVKISAITGYQQRPPDPEKLGLPAGWFEVCGRLEVFKDGSAIIEGYNQ